jgi:NAD(P)-dependent dehydrogenase (short-subunit alcohol dehydrogenase family)
VEFSGKVAIVTGGASGIGRATALAFAREGASVVIADTNVEGGQKTVANVVAQGGRAVFVAADVSKAADAERITAEAVRAFGGVDVLHNNAAIARFGTVTSTPEDEWDLVIDVNLKSIYLVSRFAIPEMIKRGGGAIVNMASVHSFATAANYAAYAASKGGVMQLTKQMAIDYAPHHVRVNCICPGAIETPMLQSALVIETDAAEARKKWEEAHALNRLGQPAEIAEVVLFLASSRASFVTGAAYPVDGGMLAML